MRLVIVVVLSPATSTILPPRPLTALALATRTPMAVEERKSTPERSTTTPCFGALASSSSFVAMAFEPGESRRPVITIRRRSAPTSAWVMLDMTLRMP